MRLHPEHPASARIVRWLERNGCRHWISVDDPILVRGNVVEYTALARKPDRYGLMRETDRRHIDRQLHGDEITPLGRKRLRIRVRLSEVA